MDSAFRAMQRLSAMEPDFAAPTATMLPGCCLDFTSCLGGAHMFSCVLAVQRPAIEAERLAAHLLQQFVDERAPEHVEETGLKPTIAA